MEENNREFLIFFVGYLTTLSASRLHSDGDKTINEYGAVDGMRIGRGNRSTPRKPALLSFYPQPVPHDLRRDRTWPNREM
jgi:hypothetical protein